jgi:hypothetical protein
VNFIDASEANLLMLVSDNTSGKPKTNLEVIRAVCRAHKNRIHRPVHLIR